MATHPFTDWVLRGRAHLADGRAADALPCFRRAAREEPRSPIPPFHLGEALWLLGLAGDAEAAWRAAADLDPAFLPARLAVAEAALARGDDALASRFAHASLALAPEDARARLIAAAAAAAGGDGDGMAAVAALVTHHPALAASPALARAFAAALAVPERSDAQATLREALRPHMATLPLPLVAALAEAGETVPPEVAQRRLAHADLDPLRRLAVALAGRDAATAQRLVTAYCTLAATLPPPPVPLLWPRRTAGASLRVAWLCPAPATSDAGVWSALCGLDRTLLRAATHLVLCTGPVAATRDALAPSALAGAEFVALPLPADAADARILAARDCDVLVDVAGLACATAAFLAARPARATWSLAGGAPPHLPPLVQRVLASATELADALAATQAALDAAAGADATAPGSDAISAVWDAAVRAHHAGDVAAATAGYAEVLAAQPGFAPALKLFADAAQGQGDTDAARAGYAAAMAAAPAFIEARIAAAELALRERAFDDAARIARDGIAHAPANLTLWRMLARAESARGAGGEADAALRHALAIAPADGELHFQHGVALQAAGNVQEAARAYQRALTFAPDLVAADFNLGVLFQQQGNTNAASAAFRHVLATDPTHAAAYKNLGETLFAAGQVDAWLANFHAFERHCPTALPLAVYALEACQYRGDFAGVERYIDGLRRDEFKAGDDVELLDCLEELLYLLLFFDVEPSVLLHYAVAYDAISRSVHGEPMPAPGPRRPGPIRVGYLSADLRNHVMGKMMWQAIEHHDRARFDVFFYSTSRERDDWTERFAQAGRFEVVAALDDRAAAQRIAADDLDLLIDLSTHTRGARPGILARKPARVQITHVASAGTVGLSAIDYKLTDAFADVPESQEFQIERMLVMEGCVYPYRHVAPAAMPAFDRAALRIPADAVVIGAFVNPMKLSRRCLRAWRDVLVRIPRARLAFSPANPALQGAYLELAVAAGIDAARIVFIPQGRNDAENQARYRVVDFVLDTFPFGGVNGTLEALDMHVPVVTLVGKRHGERTSYSILRNLGVESTIAQTGRDFVDIAVRLADDAGFRAEVVSAIARGLAQSPLVDMPAHTRHLEAAYLRALAGDAAPRDAPG